LYNLQVKKLLYLNMTIEIKAPVTKEKVQQAIEQFKKEPGKKKLCGNISES